LRLQDALARFADYVIANSEAGRESLVARGVAADKIRVIPNGLNLAALHVDPAQAAAYRARLGGSSARVVGIIASLLPVKRHDTFLEAAKLVSSRVPEARFAIFGDGPLRAELEASAAEMGLAQRVVFFGAQRPAANCLGACDLLVSSSEVEGLSNSILEAMALRVPVVATDIPGNRELVRDGSTGYRVPVGDAGALAMAIERAFTHPAESAAYAEQARAWVAAQFSLTRMVEAHEALYRSVLQARRRPVLARGT
jgi:glycosyltransferase involved in cell wall biosynthesis